jgi:hypothetical protein
MHGYLARGSAAASRRSRASSDVGHCCSHGSFTRSGDATGRPCDERDAKTIEHCFSSAIVHVQQKPCRLCADHEKADMTTGDAGEVSRLRRWAILATILSGTMLAILDSSILNIFVVPIMGEFQANIRTVE